MSHFSIFTLHNIFTIHRHRRNIHYADAIAKALDLDGAEDTQLPHLDPATIDALDLDQHTLARVLAETQEGFDHCSLLLG